MDRLHKKRATQWVAQRASDLYFFFDGGDAATTICFRSHIERESDLTAQGFLPDDNFDLAHQIRVLAQEILGVLASLTETDIAIREERAALLNDFELGCKVEHITRF